MIYYVQIEFKVPTEYCHIAGHSLGKCQMTSRLASIRYYDESGIIISLTASLIGAHLAGYAGQYLRDRGLVLGRITGSNDLSVLDDDVYHLLLS